MDRKMGPEELAAREKRDRELMQTYPGEILIFGLRDLVERLDALLAECSDLSPEPSIARELANMAVRLTAVVDRLDARAASFAAAIARAASFAAALDELASMAVRLTVLVDRLESRAASSAAESAPTPDR